MTSPSQSFDQSVDLFDENEQEDLSSETGGSVEKKKSCEPKNDSVTLLDFECPFCSKYESSEYDLQFHIESNHPEFNAHDVEATATSISPSEPKAINQTSWSSARLMNGFEDINSFICPYCDVSHESRENLAEHLTVHHVEDVEHDDLEELTRNLGLMLCPLCRFMCPSETAMQLHVEAQHFTHGGSNTSHNKKASLSGTASARQGVTVCPICGIKESDPDLLKSHIEIHFSNHDNADDPSLPSTSKRTNTSGQSAASSSSSSSSSAAASSSSSLTAPSETRFKEKRKRSGYHYKHQYRQGLERAVVKGKMTPGDYYDQLANMENDLSGVDDGHSKVEGLIERLSSFYHSHSRQDQSVALCDPTDYYCGSYGDKGWGCGYRNFQMMLSCICRIHSYSQKLFSGGKFEIPSVPKIQEMIETAWQKGFDLEGCLQLEGKLSNTRKWIGATEIVATLSSMGIRCELVDFPQPSSPDGTHPLLLQWVKDYFSKDQDSKPPLYLQHQGHSRTIVGVETEKGTTKLLLFDPSTSLERVTVVKTGPLNWKEIGLFRRNLAGFKAKQYQIVSANGLLSEDEYERSKKLASTRVL